MKPFYQELLAVIDFHAKQQKAIDNDFESNSEFLKQEADKQGMNLDFQMFSHMDPLTQDINSRILDQTDNISQ